MPVLDGISATKEIRETIPPAKQPIIVALTANSSEDDINNCMAIGMNDFISKPVELDVLEKTLNEHLDLGGRESEPEVVFQMKLRSTFQRSNLKKQLRMRPTN